MKNEPIRILHILQRMEAAGVQTFLMNIYRNINREKVQFDFLVHYKTPQFFDEEIERLGGKIYRFSVREDYNLFKYIRELNHFFKEHQEYKIVHGHMPVLGFIYLNIAKKCGIKVRIAHSHTAGFVRDKNLFKRFIKKTTNKLYSKYATELFACSMNAGEYMFGSHSFSIINNAIDVIRFKFNKKIRDNKRKELSIDKNYVIGCVGRFEKVKNQKFSLKIFEELIKKNPNIKMLFIGSGSMENNIKKKVEKKRLDDKILFLGNRKDIPELFMAMDVFLFPSLYEGLGIVAIESQATGTPVVCTDTLPKEINITNLVHRVSLNASAASWANEIKKTKKDILLNTDTSNLIKQANYDVKEVAFNLQKYYLEKYSNLIDVESEK